MHKNLEIEVEARGQDLVSRYPNFRSPTLSVSSMGRRMMTNPVAELETRTSPQTFAKLGGEKCTVLARRSMDIPSAEAPAFVGMTVGAGMTWMFAGMTVVAE